MPGWRPRGTTATAGQVTARYVVVADGANSRFGWSLGNQRNRAYPQGMALARLLDLAAPRRALDRLLARPEGRSGQRDARVTGGSSRWATAASTWASACSRTGDRWKGVNTTQMLEAFCQLRPRIVGDQA